MFLLRDAIYFSTVLFYSGKHSSSPPCCPCLATLRYPTAPSASSSCHPYVLDRHIDWFQKRRTTGHNTTPISLTKIFRLLHFDHWKAEMQLLVKSKPTLCFQRTQVYQCADWFWPIQFINYYQRPLLKRLLVAVWWLLPIVGRPAEGLLELIKTCWPCTYLPVMAITCYYSCIVHVNQK